MSQILLDNASRGTTTLLSSCVPSTTSDQLLDGTTVGDGTGDTSFNFGRKLKQWAADLNSMQAELYAAENAPVLTVAQLTNTVSASIVGSLRCTSDGGLYQSNGTNWEPAAEFTILVSGVPIINRPTGSMGNNGVFTLGTNLREAYPSCYMYFAYGDIWLTSGAGNSPGMYYCVMSGLAGGTVYNYQYTNGNPQIPASLTGLSFSTTGPGAFTGITGASIYAHTANIPANSMGPNGRLIVKVNWSSNSSATNKRFNVLIGGSSVGAALVSTTSQFITVDHNVFNRGTGKQIALSSANGDPNVGTNETNLSIDTTQGVPVVVLTQLDTAATDWTAIESVEMTVCPGGLLDAPATFTYTPSSASIVPPGAAANGCNTNLFYLAPQVSDIDFTNSTSGKLFPGLYYNSIPAWSNSSPVYATNVTLFGKSVLSLAYINGSPSVGIATQTQHSTQGVLSWISGANPWYCEWTSWLSNSSGDHFPACWMLPTEHSGTNNYWEYDVDEGGFPLNDGNNLAQCMSTHLLNWVSGSVANNYNNLGVGNSGPNINRLVPNTFGLSYNPTTGIFQTWLNGVKQPFNASDAVAHTTASTQHFYMIIGAQSQSLSNHAVAGPSYNMYIEHISAWTP